MISARLAWGWRPSHPRNCKSSDSRSRNHALLQNRQSRRVTNIKALISKSFYTNFPDSFERAEVTESSNQNRIRFCDKRNWHCRFDRTLSSVPRKIPNKLLMSLASYHPTWLWWSLNIENVFVCQKNHIKTNVLTKLIGRWDAKEIKIIQMFRNSLRQFL